jgi:hypothetical protein
MVMTARLDFSTKRLLMVLAVQLTIFFYEIPGENLFLLEQPLKFLEPDLDLELSWCLWRKQ